MRGKRNTPLNEYGMDAGLTRNSQSSQSGKVKLSLRITDSNRLQRNIQGR
jgi:hypothetical protein